MQSNECWLQSSFYIHATRTKGSKVRGKHVLVTYQKVKEKFGAPLAKTIYDEKKAMQLSKSQTDQTVYHMEHPDIKNNQDISGIKTTHTYICIYLSIYHCFILHTNQPITQVGNFVWAKCPNIFWPI